MPSGTSTRSTLATRWSSSSSEADSHRLSADATPQVTYTAECCCGIGLSALHPEALAAYEPKKKPPGMTRGRHFVTLTPRDQAGSADLIPGRLPPPKRWARPYRQRRPQVQHPGPAHPLLQAQSVEHRQEQPALGRPPEREHRQEQPAPGRPPEREHRQEQPALGRRREPAQPLAHRSFRRVERLPAHTPPRHPRLPPRHRRLPGHRPRPRPRRPACTRSLQSSTEQLPRPDSTRSRRRISQRRQRL